MRSALYVAPSPHAPKAAPLKPGTELHVYRDYPAPRGWLLARRPGAEIGFVSALHLEGKRDARLDGPAPAPATAPRATPASAPVARASSAPARDRASSPSSFTADDLLRPSKRRR
jgi:hypothetical protein